MQKIEIKDLKNLSWKSWFMLVTLLLAAGLGGGTVNVMMNVQGEVSTIKGILQHEINSTFYGLQSPFNYVVSVVQSGATVYYTLQNGTDGSLLWYSTNKTAVHVAAAGNLTYGGSIFCKNQTWSTTVTLLNTVGIIENYNGTYRYYSNQGKFIIPQLASNPSTSGWGLPELGQMWLNTGDKKYYWWNSTHTVEFGTGSGTTGPAGPAGASSPLVCSYLVFKNATATYMISGSTGQSVGSSTNSSYVLNMADDNITAAGGGILFVKTASYTMTAGFLQGKTTRLIGEGSRNTWFVQSTNNFDMITIDATDVEYDWAIEGIGIDMNSISGNGIYSARSSQGAHLGQCKLYDIHIQEIAAGYCGVWLVDPFFMDMRLVEVRVNSGTAFKFTSSNTPDLHTGNSIMQECFATITGSSAVGLNVTNAATVRAFNLVQIDRFQAYCGNSATTGCYGVWWKGNALEDYVTFNSLNIELVETGVYLDSVCKMTFINPFIWTDGVLSTAIGVRLVGTTRNVQVFGGYITAGGDAAAKAWSDESTSTKYKNLVEGTSFDNRYGDFETNTRIHDIVAMRVGGDYGKYVSNHAGSLTNTSATTFVFDHMLFAAPNIIHCYFSTTGITWTASATVTTLTITITGTLPASITCFYDIAYDPTFNDPS